MFYRKLKMFDKKSIKNQLALILLATFGGGL